MEELDYGKIGQRIRQARKTKGWSQETLASKCEISLSFMGHIERGTRNMSLDTFACICGVLETGADELLWGVIHPENLSFPDIWNRSQRQGCDNYEMYVKIMKSVAEIINGTGRDVPQDET